MNKVSKKYPAIPFVAPFFVFITLLGLKSSLPIDPKWEYPIRVLIVAGVTLLLSRKLISWPPTSPLASIVVGASVFVIWVSPDMIWPSYRHHWLFENSLMGTPESSLPEELRSDAAFLIFRLFGTGILVPIIEELFWRGWLMRYLINSDFRKIPLGTYSAVSFWITAILFASEHGPFWEVGLLAGLIYNWWILRARNLADCMLAHAVTNCCLALFVIIRGQWQYWL
jgi:uncharacterized protein